MTQTPTKLLIKRDEKVEITWQDGTVSVYPISYLRSNCPCAMCKTVRQENAQKPKSSLSILPGNYANPLKIETVERVGNYALRLEWSDQHGSGIYSYSYLREIAPP